MGGRKEKGTRHRMKIRKKEGRDESERKKDGKEDRVKVRKGEEGSKDREEMKKLRTGWKEGGTVKGRMERP